MNYESFVGSLTLVAPDADLTIYLQALWYDAKGDWEKAHTLIQDIEDKTAAWIHAYLHRKEGDLSNADYWYRKAGKNGTALSLQEEWENITKALLSK
ncbi:hypothetical protein BH11BAC6_BH11BAC6_00240 [soil metagenome]